MRIRELIWDDETIEHVARHGVEPEEIEEVCQGHPHILRSRGGRYIVLGQSRAGRYLTIVIAPLSGGRATVITARAMAESERRRYLRR